MKCPYCSHSDTSVVDSRLNQYGDITRRRRQCGRCDGRFTTYERVEHVMPVVCKKDGRREAFSREKLISGIQRACQKRSIPQERIESEVERILKRIQSFGLKEIPSKVIGQMVMSALHRLDKVAYVRFASVYRQFRDVDEFMAELKGVPDELLDQESMSFPFLIDSPTKGGQA